MRPLFIFPVKECSTRLPRKNLLEIKGRPLFSYPFEAMLKASKRFDALCVLTTESYKIRNIARTIGETYYSDNIPLLFDCRSEYMAKDPYQMADVCKYVIEKYSLQDYNPLVVVQSTLPFITEQDIVNCIDLYEKSIDKSIRVFKVVDKQWGYNASCIVSSVHALEQKTVLQSLGGIVVFRTSYLLEFSRFPPYAVPYILPKERAIDVDDRTDFIFAKALMEAEDENESGAGV